MFVVISGCSGGGKSSLLAEFKKMGHCVVEEPGRRIIAEEKASSGAALPWVNMTSFAKRAVEMSRSDLLFARNNSGIVFFDRGSMLADCPTRKRLAESSIIRTPYFWHHHGQKSILAIKSADMILTLQLKSSNACKPHTLIWAMKYVCCQRYPFHSAPSSF